MSTLFISTINTKITETYLSSQVENQYFERKGLGEKDTKPTKIAEELIGMLNSDGGVLAFGVADDGEIQDLTKELKEAELNKYRSLCFDFIHPACNIELEEVRVNGKLIFLYYAESDFERLFARKDNEQVFIRKQDIELYKLTAKDDAFYQGLLDMMKRVIDNPGMRQGK